MLKASLRRLLNLGATLVLVFASASSPADDTEIYFNSGSSSGNTGDPLRPNVLFILDTSGSMNEPVTGGTQSRIAALKEAMTTIISQVQDINLGLMRFTRTEGGAVLMPIQYIDKDVTTVVGEASGNITSTGTLSSGSSDGEQNVATGAVTLTDPTLDIAQTLGVTGGTFTISNGGIYGSLLSTPILNMPQSGILGMHRIEDRPVAVDGKVVIRPMMYVALSYDHRIVDGREAVTFLKRIKECVENPELIMMEI